jgi:ABC-type Mn2+/Zn2+ transport system permease subunit
MTGMHEILLDPFTAEFMQRALAAGLLAAVTCAVVGTWVVLRGLSFMGDALAHGVLPGIAVAYVIAGSSELATTIGAAAAAFVVVAGVNVVQRRSRLSEDAGIGLLFVGMLALGVMIISRGAGNAYFGDLLNFLFGAPLGVSVTGIVLQGIAALLCLVGVVVGYRAFLTLSFDERKAQLLGLHPRLARVILLALVATAIVSSYRTVGNLLVFGLLIAPPATASLLARRVPVMMGTAVGVGMASVYVGLLLSYHFDLAAGAAMASTAVAAFFVVLAASQLTVPLRRHHMDDPGSGATAGGAAPVPAGRR